jgi:hypothetical protein
VALMLNIFLSGEFNFDQSGGDERPRRRDVKVRTRFRISRQIEMLRKAISEGKRACRIVQWRH